VSLKLLSLAPDDLRELGRQLLWQGSEHLLDGVGRHGLHQLLHDLDHLGVRLHRRTTTTISMIRSCRPTHVDEDHYEHKNVRFR